MVDVGVISRESAIAWGMTGPNLRASGVPRDLRKDSPYLGYENYQFDVPIADEGDCYARYQIRMEEMRQSIRICRQVLDTMPAGPVNLADSKSMLPDKERVLMSMEELIHHFIVSTQGIDAPAGEVYFAAENPKGELGFYIHSKGGGVPVPPEDPQPLVLQPLHHLPACCPATWCPTSRPSSARSTS